MIIRSVKQRHWQLVPASALILQTLHMVGSVWVRLSCFRVRTEDLICVDFFLASRSTNMNKVAFVPLKVIIATVLCGIQGFSPIDENLLTVIEFLLLPACVAHKV
jgi:hypothetical protein